MIGQGTPVVVVSLSGGVNPVFLDNAVAFKAVVTDAGNTPTGTVAFYDNGVELTACKNQSLTGGVAICTVNTTSTALTVGANLITASYNGDTNFAPVANAASTGYSETVADFTMSVSNATYTVIPGNTATYTFTVSPASPSTIFPAAINFTISGLPTGATSTFTPSSIAACNGSCATTVTLVIDTVLNNTTSERQPGAGANPIQRLAPLSLALLLLPFAAKLRKAGRRMSRMLSIALLLAAGAAAVAGLSGCSNTGFFGQPEASHTITITGTSGSLVHTSNVTLTVE